MPRRLWLRSLQSRLVVGVVSLVLLIVLIIGVSTWWFMHSFLDKRLNDQLRATANGDLRTLFAGSPYPGTSLRPQDVWAVAILSDGSRAYPSERGVDRLRLRSEDMRRISVLPPDHTATVQTADGKQLRVTTEHVTVFPSGQQFVAVIGLSTGDERRTLHRVLVLELTIGGAAVAIAFVLTTVGVRRSLRNLYAVTGTAREVAAELSPTGAGLDRRVPVVEEGTEVGQLAESMNTLLAAVETQFAARLESERRMRQFLADASHELRTPLTSIKGYAELARLRGAGDAGADELGDDLKRIEDEGTRMSRLVDDLLTLARTDRTIAGAEDFPAPQHLIDVAELLDDVAGSSRAAFPERQITVDAAPNLSVLGDPDQLVRVVLNLVTNAAVHTDPAGPIAVRSFGDGADVVIQVIDAGPGLPPGQAAHVFERFWRADKARSRSRGGTGLGMAIVASLVHSHGGSVRFDSSVERGSTVTVRLPAAT